MDGVQLKQAIATDLETLKSIDLEIMEGKNFYRINLRLYSCVFLIIFFTIFAAEGLTIPLGYYGVDKYFTVTAYVAMMVQYAGFEAITIFIFTCSMLNNYMIFSYQIRPKLLTGDLLAKKIKFVGLLAYAIFLFTILFATCLIPPLRDFPPISAIIAGIIAFVVSGLIIEFIIEMEAKRIGVSALFILIKKYFDKDKKLNETDLLK